ncbi:hypothetical protein GCM10009850_052300 [Nonomuraea monospora]|uniref:Uncharacterized protein n=1 Tax=Nonomuraea monospora TaxID=568818 RepID=A0ABN3CL31_9ACTN
MRARLESNGGQTCTVGGEAGGSAGAEPQPLTRSKHPQTRTKATQRVAACRMELLLSEGRVVLG